jgi:hypothetical protein
MKQLIGIISIAVLLVGCGQQTDSQTVNAPEGKWISLFNGQDFTGWILPEFGTCEVVNGEMVLTGKPGQASPEGKYLFTQKSFGNFILKLQYRTNAGGNSGIAIRYPGDGNPAWTGYYVQILVGQDKHPTGSIHNISRAYAAVEGESIARDEQWNTMEIRCVGDEITTIVNGHQVAYGRDRRSLRGPVGLQIHDKDTVLRFKDIQIKELPDAVLEPPIEDCLQHALGEFTPLYNGTDLSGWVTYWGGDWKADGAAITGTIEDGIGWLVSEKKLWRLYSDDGCKNNRRR